MWAVRTTVSALSLALVMVSAIPGHGVPPLEPNPSGQTAGKPLTPVESELIDKAIFRENEIVKAMRERAPLVETYLQNMRPDPAMRQVPESDRHLLGHVDLASLSGDNPSNAGAGSGKDRAYFIRMLVVDAGGFDRQHYSFSFLRKDFLGTVPTAVFDVKPAGASSAGSFSGRIWVETQGGNVVRFSGNFAGPDKDDRGIVKFDSWRTNVQPDLWLPTVTYVEGIDPNGHASTLNFKAIEYVWGYAPRESTVPEPEGEGDVSPLSGQRAWTQQAEDNVLERLFQAGLLDAPSEVDKVLEGLANNILEYNRIATVRPIRVRILLTEPLESLAVGDTILLSKGLIDTSAVASADGAHQRGNLNALLAFQLAHILLAHRVDARYAFNDRLLLPDDSVFTRIPMHHTDADNDAAAKEAVKLLQVKELVDSQRYFGLYLQQLQERVEGLKALNEPVLGDGLVKSGSDPTFWLASLLPKGDKLDVKDVRQQAAVPLSSFLRVDPWSDQTITLHPPVVPVLSSAEKMPFEITPVYLKLGYFKPPD